MVRGYPRGLVLSCGLHKVMGAYKLGKGMVDLRS